MALPTEKKKRTGGARTVKDKQVIMLYKGTVEAVEVCFDPWEAMERKEADPTWSYKKVTIPMKRRVPPNQSGAPSA